MKVLEAILTLYFLVTTAVSGFWLHSNKVSAAVDITKECLDRASTGDCSFYECFEKRFTCGDDGYAISFGKRYCDRFQQNNNLFTKEGLEFVNKILLCHMNKTLTTYRQNELECYGHYDQSFVFMGDCYIPSGFCEVVVNNFMAIARILDPQDFINYRMIREVFKAARHCPNDISSEIVSKYLSYKQLIRR